MIFVDLNLNYINFNNVKSMYGNKRLANLGLYILNDKQKYK